MHYFLSEQKQNVIFLKKLLGFFRLVDWFEYLIFAEIYSGKVPECDYKTTYFLTLARAGHHKN